MARGVARPKTRGSPRHRANPRSRSRHTGFYGSYRERDTGAGLIAEPLGILDGDRAAEMAADGDAVRVRAWLDSPTYCAFQRLRLTVELTVAPGFHVYGAPIPHGYVPLSVEVALIEGLEMRPVRWPSPHPFRVEGLHEAFWVHEGTVQVATVRLHGAPWGRRPGQPGYGPVSGVQGLNVSPAGGGPSGDARERSSPRRPLLARHGAKDVRGALRVQLAE